MADQQIKGARVYRTLLIWPYAVAPAVAAMLWLFLLIPGRHLRQVLKTSASIRYVSNGNQALLLIVIASVWSQIAYNFLFFLAGLQSIPKSLIEAAAIDGAGPGGASGHRLPAALANRVLPARRQPHLLVVRHLRGGRRGDGRGPQATETLVWKILHDGFLGLDLGSSSAQSVILMVVMIVLTRAVPLHRAAGPLCKADVMVENRPFGRSPAHVVLIVGVLVVAFPVWMTFVASTHDQATMLSGRCRCCPARTGSRTTGASSRRPPAPQRRAVRSMMTNSLIMAVGVTVGKLVISILSAYAIVYFRFPFRIASSGRSS